MEQAPYIRCLPSLEMVAEALQLRGISCRSVIRERKKSYRGVRLYHGQKALCEDFLYLLPQAGTDFPVDTLSYVSAEEIPGEGDHICCPGSGQELLLDLLLEYFSSCLEAQSRMDQLVFQGGGLQELCRLGEMLLGNPICIHDDWFVVAAMSPGAREIMAPDDVDSSGERQIPEAVVEELQNDSDYVETYTHRDARIWQGTDGTDRTLYVNLWDGTVYRGRLLVFRRNRDFRRQDFLFSELLAQQALSLLKRRDLRQYRGMDGTVYKLLTGKTADSANLGRLLSTLRWNSTDQFLCARLRPQRAGEFPLLDHALHSALFRIFPGSYILLNGSEQCLILNLTRKTVSLPQIRYCLAPVCRDYCLYTGISSPVSGLQELHLAYCQAGAALDRAFQLRDERWILFFSDCAMDYLLGSVAPPLLPRHLIAPGLLALVDHDREKGTQYFETLRTYLLNERDIPKTSQALIIHRTTLLYRLKKIQPLLGVSLDDPWQRLYLLLSLWIMKKQDKLSAP